VRSQDGSDAIKSVIEYMWNEAVRQREHRSSVKQRIFMLVNENAGT